MKYCARKRVNASLLNRFVTFVCLVLVIKVREEISLLQLKGRELAVGCFDHCTMSLLVLVSLLLITQSRSSVLNEQGLIVTGKMQISCKFLEKALYSLSFF